MLDEFEKEDLKFQSWMNAVLLRERRCVLDSIVKLRIRVVCLVIALCSGTAMATDYYVDVDSRGGPADDAGPGSAERPWRTLSRAIADKEPRPGPGDTVWIRGGVYEEGMRIVRGGTAEAPLVFRAFADETPILDGGGERKNGILFSETGSADHTVLDGLTVRNFRDDGAGIFAIRRTGIVIRNVDVSGSRIGIWFSRSTKCQLLTSEIHHTAEGCVLIDTGCADMVVADNHVHHNAKGHALSVYAPGNGVRAEDEIASVEPHGPGLALIRTIDLDLSQVRGGSLKGQDEDQSVESPSLVLFFPQENPKPDGQPLPGGTARLPDGRDWFVLHNNPDWDGKCYSPDGRSALVELGNASVETLARAKTIYVAYIFPDDVVNRDVHILRNDVHHSAIQGIWVQRADGVLIQDNRTHHNGATGIQIESLCRRIWLDGNLSYANCQAYGHETGIWLDETIEAVVQNNVVYENQKGMGATQCEWTLFRWNVIRDNRAQHVTRDVAGNRGNAGAFWFSGGRHQHLGAPPGGRNNAFVHNTLLRNGWETSSWGGIQHGLPGYPAIGENRFLNNLLQGNLGKHPVYVGTGSAILDGNLYSGLAPFQALWTDRNGKETYILSDSQGWTDYLRATQQDAHSHFQESEVVSSNGDTPRPSPNSSAIDGGQPLTRTLSAGTGTEIQVADVSCFSAGLKNRVGETILSGDEIMVADAAVRVVAVDRAAAVLKVDREVTWQEGDPVTYRYYGAAPDVGAFEPILRSRSRREKSSVSTTTPSSWTTPTWD